MNGKSRHAWRKGEQYGFDLNYILDSMLNYIHVLYYGVILHLFFLLISSQC